MNVSRDIQTMLLSWVFSIVVGSVLCRAEDPVFVGKSFIGENFFLGLNPNTTDWLSLEASSDLSNWTDVASVATTNHVTIIHDPDARTIPQRFYRLRSPGFSVEHAEVKWVFQVDGDYQFRLRHRVDFQVFTGTVTVTNGQKTITDAMVNGQSVEQPDPGVYLSVEELFASLQEAQLSGCRRVAAIYDPTRGYPTWCVVEQRGQSLHEFRIAELTVVNSEQAANQSLLRNHQL